MISEDIKNRLDELVTVANDAVKVFLSENTETLNDIEVALTTINGRIIRANDKVNDVYQNQDSMVNILQPLLKEKIARLKEETDRLNQEEVNLKSIEEKKSKTFAELAKRYDKLIENLSFISGGEIDNHKASDMIIEQIQKIRNDLTEADASRKTTLDDLVVAEALKANNKRKIEKETQRLEQLTKENVSSLTLSSDEKEKVKELHRDINNNHNVKELQALQNDAHRLETFKLILTTDPNVLKEEITAMITKGADSKEINDKLGQLVRMTEPLNEMEKNMSSEIEELTLRVTNIPIEDSADHYYDTAASSAETFERVYLDNIHPILEKRVETLDQEILRRTVVLSPLISAITDFKDIIKEFDEDRNELEEEIAIANLIGNKEKELVLKEELSLLNQEIASVKVELKTYEQELATTKDDIQKSKEQKITNINQKTINSERLDMLKGRSEYGEYFRNTKNIEKDTAKLNNLKEKQGKIKGILNHSGTSASDKKEDILKSLNIKVTSELDDNDFDPARTPIEKPERSRIQKWVAAPKQLIEKIKEGFKKNKDIIIKTLQSVGLVLVTGLFLSGDTPVAKQKVEEPIEKPATIEAPIEKIEASEPEKDNSIKIGDSVVSFDGNNEAFLTAYDAVAGTNATTVNTNYVNADNGSKAVAMATIEGVRTNEQGKSLADFAKDQGVSEEEVAVLFGINDTQDGYQAWVNSGSAEKTVKGGK